MHRSQPATAWHGCSLVICYLRFIKVSRAFSAPTCLATLFAIDPCPGPPHCATLCRLCSGTAPSHRPRAALANVLLSPLSRASLRNYLSLSSFGPHLPDSCVAPQAHASSPELEFCSSSALLCHLLFCAGCSLVLMLNAFSSVLGVSRLIKFYMETATTPGSV
ncbi:hypothetical protein BC628DRAFT_1374339 [Trametes gibbosa]|nr:hypothetical protein BC628DRAFT_1374339 [Trametes gibbosa]